MVVETTLELRADEPVLRVRTRFDNPSRDHRLRVHLPLPDRPRRRRPSAPSPSSSGASTAEGAPDEFGTPTFPSRRFVSSGGPDRGPRGPARVRAGRSWSTGGRDGARATTLALTLLRATGMLSTAGYVHPSDDRPGPMNPLDGPQMIGPVDVRYALGVGPVDPYRLADDVLVPLVTTGSFGGGTRPDRGSALTVRGAEVSSVRRQAGQLEVRVFNPRPAPRRWRCRADPVGWSTYGVSRSPPSRGTSPSDAHGIATARLDG